MRGIRSSIDSRRVPYISFHVTGRSQGRIGSTIQQANESRPIQCRSDVLCTVVSLHWGNRHSPHYSGTTISSAGTKEYVLRTFPAGLAVDKSSIPHCQYEET
ncbi:hypothetical protein AVEN_69716-1 [Araneus ventricosus]|uniref:Uncharacterized protein n=1 Tax=Araneus ventricosus TaxID=182803 RepID=A0A4Y2PUK6_ARAVE|nr:hypothetical protein AVEN_69716-1 [Araneus ventricosus]